MKNLTTIGMVILIVLVGAILFQMSGDNGAVTFGSADPSAYKYTQHANNAATNTQMFAGQGIFGSVVINEDAANAVSFYDATSTTGYSITNGTKIADFEAAQAEGVYTFNVGVTKGLVINDTNSTAFAGDWTVIYQY